MLRKFLKNKNQKGATLIEYAILCGVMVTAAVLMLGNFQNQASDAFDKVGSKLKNAAEGE